QLCITVKQHFPFHKIPPDIFFVLLCPLQLLCRVANFLFIRSFGQPEILYIKDLPVIDHMGKEGFGILLWYKAFSKLGRNIGNDLISFKILSQILLNSKVEFMIAAKISIKGYKKVFFR